MSTPADTSRTHSPEQMSTAYGFEQVGEGEKQGKVDEVFHSVARRYDMMNDIMSLGVHRLWKDAMVAKAAPSKRPGWKSLDVAGGTGDIAFRLVEASDRQAHVAVLDINSSMLDVGRHRAEKAGLLNNLEFVEANAEELPFDNNIFDAYTVAFGIRNVPRMDHALAEARRVLKPGGQILVLEFSEVDMPMLDKFYDMWSFNAIPPIGRAVTGDAESYKYLVESIRKFPNQNRFADYIRDAGFERVDYRNMSGGIVALHTGWKI
ncbi:MAG: bifunctional demethylmenaquinone methyltransferase/2-methoxy-6-polyprenyl-1,4-benzoquinol methylase UbiE [Rhizobiaceae bacterium]|nr:bifunctional demethylmenaquinone methyltransferase/2-methoxy-6-polyprenyl-1,4-benzoquinol methylase UbiE [Hyphomicrobiales bacterium]NRB29144.1 bifunctional demethylmenaquinone methyltransferase/2-methoxy-6-polyprenyl-1,4-benzoquinol methylase UbiE [Rhizobiaceae bacterium]